MKPLIWGSRLKADHHRMPVPQVGGAGLDGAAYLPAAIASHLPLDLVVIMLGTNDLKAMYKRSPLRIALGVGELVDLVQTAGELDGGLGHGRILIAALHNKWGSQAGSAMSSHAALQHSCCDQRS